jgi:hypothetical protein
MILFGLEIILFFATGSAIYEMYNSTNKVTNKITNNDLPSYNSISPPPAIQAPSQLPPPSYYQ